MASKSETNTAARDKVVDVNVHPSVSCMSANIHDEVLWFLGPLEALL
jgi:hypothetical protein